MDNIPWDNVVEIRGIPPGWYQAPTCGDTRHAGTNQWGDGMAVLSFCARAMDKTHQGNQDIARRMTGTIESQFADQAAKMKLLAQMVEAQPRPGGEDGLPSARASPSAARSL